MSDDELLAYVDAHSRTPRALFSGIMIKRLLELAGTPNPDLDDGLYVLFHEDAKPYLDMAIANRKKS